MKSDKEIDNRKTMPHLWKKGCSGNPSGRPRKDVSLTSLLKLEIEKHPEINGIKSKYSWRQLLVKAWLSLSLKNPVMFKELLDRLEGHVPQPLVGANNGPIRTESVNIQVVSETSRELTQQILEGNRTDLAVVADGKIEAGGN